MNGAPGSRTESEEAPTSSNLKRKESRGSAAALFFIDVFGLD